MSKNTDLSELINYLKGKTTGQLVAPYYTSATSFTGTIAGYLGFDSSGNILSIASGSQWLTNGANIYFSTGNVGIGTSTPAYKLDVVGDINITGSFRVNGTPIGTGGGGVSGSGTINYLAKWSSSTGITNSQIFDNGTDVAIGTSSPLYKFTVRPTTNINFGIGKATIFATDDTIFVNAVNNTYGSIPLAVNASHIGFYIGFTEAMRINGSAQMLLGTTSGVSGGGLLQVAGDVNITGTFKVNGTAIGGSGNISGSGSGGYISKFDSSNYISNSALYDNGFNIWLNTTGYTLVGAPSKGYHVYDTTSAGITFKTNTSNYGSAIKRIQATSTLDIYNDGYVNIGANTNANAVFITSSGVSFGSTTLDSGYGFQMLNNINQKAKAYSWDTYSDARIKKDVVDLNYGLNEVMKLRAVRYNQYNSLITNDQILLTESYKQTIGFIAQDVHEIVQEAVTKGSQSELWGMDYNKLIPVLVKSIQDQQGEIETLKKQIAILRNDLC
jgi:hypothetical protein